MKFLIIILALTTVLFSCNKEKYYSKKLIKGEEWTVESITAGGQSLNSNSSWTVKGDDIYKTVSQVSWQGSDPANATDFEWQFQDKGEAWVLNNFCNCDEADGPLLDELDYLANDISGKYEVVKHKRKEMVFRSSETKKYAGQLVEIKLTRK